MGGRSQPPSGHAGTLATRTILVIGWLGACAVAVGLYALGHRRVMLALAIIGVGALAMAIARARVVRERSSLPRRR